ncbi:hypothetical protein LH86_04145 [Cedecea neteri]|nr:hypothetical protein LH86_04145 [Cedecea neteri]
MLNNGQITYFPIPDISQKLPVFSWDDVFMGKDELPDKDFINDLEKIEKDINELIHMETYDLILFPMGYGDHKDHVMLSLLGRKYVGNSENIYFYRDIPYNNKGKWCDAFFSPVIDITFNLEHKIEIVKKYEKGLQVGDDILAEVINFHQSATECKETLYEYHIK